MKKPMFVIIAASVCVVAACGEKETKTLYGSWEPVLEADLTNIWQASDENFILSVAGKCEEIEVTITQRGDLTNPDVPVQGAKCSGNRDVLTFTDSAGGPSIAYNLQLDASKDTLTGTVTTPYANIPTPVVSKIKFLRIQ